MVPASNLKPVIYTIYTKLGSGWKFLQCLYNVHHSASKVRSSIFTLKTHGPVVFMYPKCPQKCDKSVSHVFFFIFLRKYLDCTLGVLWSHMVPTSNLKPVIYTIYTKLGSGW